MKSKFFVALAIALSATTSFAYEGTIAVKCSLMSEYTGTMSIPTDLKKWKTVKATDKENEHIETKGGVAFNGMRISGTLKGYQNGGVYQIMVTDAGGFEYLITATKKDDNTIAFPMWVQYYVNEQNNNLSQSVCEIHELKPVQTAAGEQPYVFKQ